MNGFFAVNDSTAKVPLSLLPACGTCGLFRNCQSPKMKVYGQGRRNIMLIGEAPGRVEDEQGKPFRGASGQLAKETLRKFDVDMDRDCWIINAARCRPANNKLPTKAIEHCRPLTIKDVTELKPEVIILLGGSAIKSLIGWVWKEDCGKPSRWDGWRIPCQQLNAWICPTWHPAYLLHKNAYGREDEGNAVRKLMFERHVGAACELEGRPWDTVPDYKSKVRIVYDPDEAARLIDAMAAGNKPVAFDIETSMVKPEHDDAFIHSASVSDGKLSVAFPWHGAAIEAMKRFVISDVPKIGYNTKFESRWVKRKLGVWVNNWVWDGMLAAHVLDNRPDICGLAFQEFVLLGHSHKDEMSQWLRSEGSSTVNRIKEAPLDRILLYCGLDSLVEHKVAMKQAKQMGVKLWQKL